MLNSPSANKYWFRNMSTGQKSKVFSIRSSSSKLILLRMTIGTPNMNKLATNSSIKYLMSLIVVLTNWTYFAVPSNNLIQSKVFRIKEKLVIADIIDRVSDDTHELFGKLVRTMIGVNNS